MTRINKSCHIWMSNDSFTCAWVQMPSEEHSWNIDTALHFCKRALHFRKWAMHSSKKPYICVKEPCISAKETLHYISAFLQTWKLHLCISAKVSAKELCILCRAKRAKELCILCRAKELHFCKRNVLCKRALHFFLSRRAYAGLFLQKSSAFPQTNYAFLQKDLYLCKRALHFCKGYRLKCFSRTETSTRVCIGSFAEIYGFFEEF